MIDMLRRINDALPRLVATILLYGVVIELAGVWFVEDKISYSIGLWYGVAIAVGLAINLAMVIFDAVTLGDSEHANRRIIAKSILRYVVVVILFFILGYFNFGNLFMAFVGVLGLKVSAYLQGLIHGIFQVEVFGQKVWITTSHACILIVMALMLIFAIVANRKMKHATDKPDAFQNVIELIVEMLDGMVESTMGKWAPKFVNYISTISYSY